MPLPSLLKPIVDELTGDLVREFNLTDLGYSHQATGNRYSNISDHWDSYFHHFEFNLGDMAYVPMNIRVCSTHLYLHAARMPGLEIELDNPQLIIQVRKYIAEWIRDWQFTFNNNYCD